MTGCEGAFGGRASGAREHEHVRDVDERKCRDASDHVLHQHCEAVGVIQHATHVAGERSAVLNCSTCEPSAQILSDGFWVFKLMRGGNLLKIVQVELIHRSLL